MKPLLKKKEVVEKLPIVETVAKPKKVPCNSHLYKNIGTSKKPLYKCRWCGDTKKKLHK